MTWDLPRGEEFLPRTSLSELKRRMQAELEAKPHLRLLIALHRKQGKSLDEIAEACGVPRSTVHGTLERFVMKGAFASHSVKQSGRPKRLNAAQLRGLRARLLQSPTANGFREGFWNTRMVLALVQREYGVGFTREHMTRLLAKLGFSYKKPRPTNPRRASNEEVAAFKKKRVERYWLPDAKAESSSSKTKARSLSLHTRRAGGTHAGQRFQLA